MKKGILLTLLLSIVALHQALAQQAFDGAQWVGAITRAQSRLPIGRHFTGSELKASRQQWAQADTLSRRSIVLRRSLHVGKKVKQATIHITGLGCYELSLNHQKVGNTELAPAWSDYDKTIYYDTYDVTRQLRRGSNELRVLLGNGFYNEQGGRYHKLKVSFGPPTLLFSLHITYADGRQEHLVSDSQWQWAPSPITFNSLYGGEDYDARLEPRQWQRAVVQESPRGTLRPQQSYPVKIMERYGVKRVIRRDSILVLDMGQNLAGFPEITVKGQRGQSIRITPAETLTPDRRCNQKQTGRPHYYTYTLAGRGNETWHPRFSYYGYRYLQVEGDISVLQSIQSCFLHNSAPRISTFSCSNERINATHRLIDRAIRSNWQWVWTDCPHREKLGWLEQDWLNGEALVYNYDCRTMLQQTLQIIADAQHADGSMPEIAPEYVMFTGSWAKPFQESPEWGGALIALPFLYARHYGDSSMVERYRPAMKRYVDYLATQDSAYILRMGLGDWYDYGPWRAGFAHNTPMPLVSTAHYYWWNHLLGEQRADSIREAFNRTFYDAAHHRYATGSQCAQAIALCMHLVPDADRQAVADSLVADIRRHGTRLTTGDVGNRYLFQSLIDMGRRDVLYEMLNHDSVPGYGYQIQQGMTTLTEQWDPKHGASMNHFMLAHIENFLIPDLLGIVRRGNDIHIAPHPVGDLTWCKGSTAAAQGTVSVSWRLDGDTFFIVVDIPEGATATLALPYGGSTETLSAGHHERRQAIQSF